eukprot:Nk52_evm58s158 gene=Nk52_evmTU58s158
MVDLDASNNRSDTLQGGEEEEEKKKKKKGQPALATQGGSIPGNDNVVIMVACSEDGKVAQQQQSCSSSCVPPSLVGVEEAASSPYSSVMVAAKDSKEIKEEENEKKEDRGGGGEAELKVGTGIGVKEGIPGGTTAASKRSDKDITLIMAKLCKSVEKEQGEGAAVLCCDNPTESVRTIISTADDDKASKDNNGMQIVSNTAAGTKGVKSTTPPVPADDVDSLSGSGPAKKKQKTKGACQVAKGAAVGNNNKAKSTTGSSDKLSPALTSGINANLGSFSSFKYSPSPSKSAPIRAEKPGPSGSVMVMTTTLSPTSKPAAQTKKEKKGAKSDDVPTAKGTKKSSANKNGRGLKQSSSAESSCSMASLLSVSLKGGSSGLGGEGVSKKVAITCMETFMKANDARFDFMAVLQRGSPETCILVQKDNNIEQIIESDKNNEKLTTKEGSGNEHSKKPTEQPVVDDAENCQPLPKKTKSSVEQCDGTAKPKDFDCMGSCLEEAEASNLIALLPHVKDLCRSSLTLRSNKYILTHHRANLYHFTAINPHKSFTLSSIAQKPAVEIDQTPKEPEIQPKPNTQSTTKKCRLVLSLSRIAQCKKENASKANDTGAAPKDNGAPPSANTTCSHEETMEEGKIHLPDASFSTENVESSSRCRSVDGNSDSALGTNTPSISEKSDGSATNSTPEMNNTLAKESVSSTSGSAPCQSPRKHLQPAGLVILDNGPFIVAASYANGTAPGKAVSLIEKFCR